MEENVKDLIEDSQVVKSLIRVHNALCKDPNIDKMELKFSSEIRCSVFSTTVSLEQYTGKYGSSSVGTNFNVNNKTVTAALIKYLNKNMEEVLLGISREIDKQIEKTIDSRKKELNDELAILNSFTKEK
jgi:hypothetical protein